MRLIATSDTHKSVDLTRKGWFPDADVFVHAGDLMRTGYVTEWYAMLEWLAKAPYKTKLFTPGNHDFHLQVYPGPALQELRQAGVTVIGLPGNSHYSAYKLPNGMTLLGLPYVTGLPRWAFNIAEKDLAYHLSQVGKHDIVVSHSPVYGYLDQLADGTHCGLKLYRQYQEKHKPALWINGHIHESYGSMEANSTRFHNVAMCDRQYEHTNPPHIIDI
jgi:Icc-related predicted phosphoesterase